MKIIILLVFTLALAVSNYKQQKFKLSTFKTVPKDMYGCGDVLYLTKEDKKAGRMLYADNYGDAMLMVNGKFLRFQSKKISGEYVQASGKYKLDVQISNKKQEDTEYHTFDAILTVYEGAKIVFKQKVIGDGGC